MRWREGRQGTAMESSRRSESERSTKHCTFVGFGVLVSRAGNLGEDDGVCSFFFFVVFSRGYHTMTIVKFGQIANTTPSSEDMQTTEYQGQHL